MATVYFVDFVGRAPVGTPSPTPTPTPEPIPPKPIIRATNFQITDRGTLTFTLPPGDGSYPVAAKGMWFNVDVDKTLPPEQLYQMPNVPATAVAVNGAGDYEITTPAGIPDAYYEWALGTAYQTT